jgi:hypothetical protein
MQTIVNNFYIITLEPCNSSSKHVEIKLSEDGELTEGVK